MRNILFPAHPDADVEREYVRAMIDRAANSFVANAIGLLLLACACLVVPFGKTLAIGLLLRTLAVVNSAFNTKRLLHAVRTDAPLDGPIRHFTLGMAFAGFTWGLLLWFIPIASLASLSAVIVLLIVAVGVTLITAASAPAPRVMVAFQIPFAITLTAWLASMAGSYGVMPVFFALGLCVGTLSFGLGLTRQAHEAARIMVESRRMTAELAEANERLEQAMGEVDRMARHDMLTGLLNRRSFDEQMEAIMLAGEQSSWAVMLIDLDHFKSINDSAGHHGGDAVLRETGALLACVADTLPRGTLAARVGGEEFAILVPIVRGDALKDFATTLCGRFRCIEAPPGHGGTISASIGVADWQEGEGAHQLMQRADRALYRAKHGGRDRAIAA